MKYDNVKPEPAIKVNDNSQYEIVAKVLNSKHRIAHEPPRNEKTKLIPDEYFPLYLQMCWLPKCGDHVRVFDKKTDHRNYIEFAEFNKGE